MFSCSQKKQVCNVELTQIKTLNRSHLCYGCDKDLHLLIKKEKVSTSHRPLFILGRMYRGRPFITDRLATNIKQEVLAHHSSSRDNWVVVYCWTLVANYLDFAVQPVSLEEGDDCHGVCKQNAGDYRHVATYGILG